MRGTRFLLIATLTLVGVESASSFAQPRYQVSIVLREGDAVAGIGVVTTIDNLAVNSAGTWIVQADTNADSSTDSILVRSGLLFLRENDPLPAPAGASLSSFDGVSLGTPGAFGGNLFLRGMPANMDSGVYLDTSLIVQESQVSTAPEFSPNTVYTGFFDAKVNAQNRIAMVASVDDPAIPSTTDRALVIATTAGGALTGETALAKEGDILPGQTEPIVDFGTGPHLTSLSGQGQLLYFADLAGDASLDGVLYLDLDRIAQEGRSSPVSGRTYELLASRGLDVNAYGQIAFKANLDGDIANDELIVAHGQPLVREGSGIPAISPWSFTSFGAATAGPVAVDDLGNVLWFGDWNDTDITVDTGLFLNDVLLVRKGDVLPGGPVLTTIASGEDAFTISDDGHFILFEGDLDGSANAALLMKVQGPPPVPDGGRVPGPGMEAVRNPNGLDVDVSWDAASCPAPDYNIFYGDLAGVSAYTYTGEACSIGPTGSSAFTPPSGNIFFVVVSEDASSIEGVHGFDSTGQARPASAGGRCGVVAQIRSDRCP